MRIPAASSVQSPTVQLSTDQNSNTPSPTHQIQHKCQVYLPRAPDGEKSPLPASGGKALQQGHWVGALAIPVTSASISRVVKFRRTGESARSEEDAVSGEHDIQIEGVRVGLEAIELDDGAAVPKEFANPTDGEKAQWHRHQPGAQVASLHAGPRKFLRRDGWEGSDDTEVEAGTSEVP